ncbi:MAG: PrsW family intramembrane metalloprotease [Candidatus Vogelbacteria bacterium]|nr:PrsW family intramembrane metalloprotease [Candidatus Vogelbacteria bacterium]
MDILSDSQVSNILLALAGGVVPPILWLLFWLQEDYKRPEPKGMIVLAFVYGGLSTAIALPLELGALSYITSSTMALVAIATIEEIIKYVAAHFAAFKRPAYDEPIDALVYMITASLGFAAVENTLYLITALSRETQFVSILVALQRFVSPTVLHIVSSAIVGLLLAFSFYKRRSIRREYLAIGLILAIALHAIFNYFILNGNGTDYFSLVVWMGALIIILLFEKVKYIQRKFVPR